MFNFTFIVIFVAALWLGGFLYYIYLSRQQENISSEIESLEKELGSDERDI